jgi:DNA-binding NarL/FixJ family response regulator
MADVMLLYIDMPVLDEFATILQLREQYLELHIVTLSMLDDRNYVG